MVFRTAALACVATIGLSGAVHATTLVTTRAGLAANDSIDWGQIGPASDIRYNLPVTATSVGGVTATLDYPSPFPTIYRFDSGFDFGGGFPDGEHLVYAPTGEFFPLVISFDSPVKGAGANFEPGNVSVYTAHLAAYSAANTLLGTVSESGFSQGVDDPPGSAIFIGITEATADIASIQFSVDFNKQPFAIDQLSMVTGATDVRDVPEPGTMALLGAGLMGLTVLRRRKNSRAG